jgi:glycerol-3-phosphate dehydrogenase
MTDFDSTLDRDEAWAVRPAFLELENHHSEVLVIGGGINGISIMRDLSLQGVKVTLIDAGDLISGASAASSHMIHGGIRYLENGEFRLVRESVQERNDLLRTAPHVVKPLRTAVPIFSLTSGILKAPMNFLNHGKSKTKAKRSERGALLIAIGLVIYESFSRVNGVMDRFSFYGAKRAAREIPSLHPKVKYMATYFDASVHEPERLALDLVSDAVATGNARVLTYAKAVGTKDGGVIIEDALSHQTLVTFADVVVNASGPLTDITNSSLGRQTQFMGGTKGSHIVVDHPQLYSELAGRELFFENKDGRIVLIYPVKGRVLIGTTDIFVESGAEVVCTEEEVDYFFNLVEHILPGIHMERSQIVFRFSGIRPLPKQDAAQPGFVSRDYKIDQGILPNSQKTPLFSVVGGKWTTFRALGEHVSNLALAELSKVRSVSTLGLEIGGGKNFPTTEKATEDWVAARASVLGLTRTRALLSRYGTAAEKLIKYLELNGDTELENLKGYSQQEIAFLAIEENAVRLDDFLLRRTTLAFSGLLNQERVQELAKVAAAALGWSAEQMQSEITRAWDILQFKHGVEKTGGRVAI